MLYKCHRHRGLARTTVTRFEDREVSSKFEAKPNLISLLKNNYVCYSSVPGTKSLKQKLKTYVMF